MTTLLPASSSVQPVSQPTTNALALYDFWRTVDRSNNEHYAAEIACFMQRPAIQTILDRISVSDDKDTSSSALVPFWPFGYVYAAWNPLFPDLIKIGATMRQKPYMRVAELSTSGVPEPFQLVDSIACKDPFALEKEIHAHYNAIRKYGRKKEFFIVSREEILEYFHIMSFKATLSQPYRSGSDNSSTSSAKQNKSSKRKHARLFTTDQEHEYTAAIERFIRNHLEVSKGVFISSKSIKDAFIKEGNDEVSDVLFFKTFRKMICGMSFTMNVVRQTSYPIKGYIGLKLK